MDTVVYRQGDVFIIPIKEQVNTAMRSARRSVLAEGEVTGHAHRVGDPKTADVFTSAGEMFLDVVAAESTITHEEHGPITLPKGLYKVRIQREYSPEEIRRVID